MMTYEVKCWPDHVEQIRDRRRKFLWLYDDRPYAVGDRLVLHVWYSERLVVEVTGLVRGPARGIPAGEIIMDIKVVGDETPPPDDTRSSSQRDDPPMGLRGSMKPENLSSVVKDDEPETEESQSLPQGEDFVHGVGEG